MNFNSFNFVWVKMIKRAAVLALIFHIDYLKVVAIGDSRRNRYRIMQKLKRKNYFSRSFQR